jgi:hypothetical protein
MYSSFFLFSFFFPQFYDVAKITTINVPIKSNLAVKNVTWVGFWFVIHAKAYVTIGLCCLKFVKCP